MIEYYDKFKNKMQNYPFSSNKMSDQYLELFENLLDQ